MERALEPAGSSEFLPWRRTTLERHAGEIETLLRFSFMPGNPESALDCPVLRHVEEALSPASHCKICQLLAALVERRAPPLSFYEDYAAVCLVALYAPRTWTAAVMLAADLCEVIHTHFSGESECLSLLFPGRILGVDVLLHFLVQRCFKAIGGKAGMLTRTTLQYLRADFMRGALTGALSSPMCFRTTWAPMRGGSGEKGDKGDKGEKGSAAGDACCALTADAEASATPRPLFADAHQPPLPATELEQPPPSPEAPEEQLLRAAFGNAQQGPRKESILDFFLAAWEGAELLSAQHKALVATHVRQRPLPCGSFEYPEDGDQCQGPCLLAPTLGLHTRNATASVCVPCECLAAHPDAHSALATLREHALTSLDNNVKLLDRVSLLLRGPGALSFVTDPILRETLCACSPQELHKHMFCDPQCASNTRATSPDVLFKIPAEENIRPLKAALAAGLLLDRNRLFDCEATDTLVLIFKASQFCKINKTTHADILREVELALRRHKFDLVSAAQTARVYA
ncbi:DNA packaging protein UL32 [Eptesicus fuscus gammaherpesvirus]|uniref:Packaging protein UL32 n=1 Tax=vespertilionid gammaherpesvirus 3 TaxID=2846598 RepID=A0A2D1A3L4_9GAMA|nr:DNA packaging protein UL32 [Eptesicus fuscus gammaherpesvirus]ATA58300.1 DNA packaging protein UL32 [Eptesicus fuscus gammaherpesvirus]WAH70902.1 putative packaging protein UL32 [Eptesicus fuscus gammaherpesvirus]